MLHQRLKPASVSTRPGCHDHSRRVSEFGSRDDEPRLSWAEGEIRKNARRLGPAESLAMLGWRATWRSWWLQIRRQIDFRRCDNAEALQAYQTMRIAEFIDINGLQAWANWRAIPRNLSGQLPDRPVFAIDLCSGIGDSTAVLAYYCAPGSEILGLEFHAAFVEHARRRSFWNCIRHPANVSFVAQNVLDTWCDRDDRVLTDGSVDLVNAIGAVGCHFDRDALLNLASQCRRVIRPDGLALMDAGRGGICADQLVDVFWAEGFRCVGQARSCWLDLGQQICLRKCS